MSTNLLDFYKDANVLLTGGTGFLGKVVIEKLLRMTDVRTIFLLARPKRGRNINERITDIFNDPLFEKLRQTRTDVDPTKRITPISGDCTQPGLGLSTEDRAMLAQHVDIVIHSAATVRFNEPLAMALTINVRATIDLLRLAKEMSHLKAFVHVSSAFANSPIRHIEERFYQTELGRSAEDACRLADELGAEAIERRCDELLGAFPNTYCYTKALAEEAVLTQAHGLPICIFRPGIVTHTCRDPMPGWIDNFYGPMSILYGVAVGVLRVIYAHMESDATFVPVDYCANAMLVCAWNAASSAKASAMAPPKIYNLVPDPSNRLKWSEYKRTLEAHGLKMPLRSMVWYPFLITTESRRLYALFCFLYHTLPGYALDLGLLLMGKKRRMVRTYEKIHRQMGVLQYFVENQWTFGVENTKALWRRLSAHEQALFPFDMMAIDWYEYFYRGLCGVRLYLGKEEPDTIPKALQRLSLFRFLHRTLQTVICGSAMFLLLWSCRRMVMVCG